MAEADYVAVAPPCPIGPLALAACLQLAGCTPNVAIQEMSVGIHYNVGHDLLSFVPNPEVLTPEGGFLAIPEGPGLGVLIDEEAVREADRGRHRSIGRASVEGKSVSVRGDIGGARFIKKQHLTHNTNT